MVSTPSKEELAALRIVVTQGINLHAALNVLASGFDPGGAVEHKMMHWQIAVSLLTKFMRETLPQTNTAVLPLLDSLGGFLDDIQKGKLSAAKEFPKASGQQMDALSANTLVMCCVAITLLNRAGETIESASRKIARLVEKYGLTLPPRKQQSSVQPWEALQGWRNHLESAEQHPHLIKLYEDTCKRYAVLSPDQCSAEAELLIKTVGEIYGTRSA